MEIVKTSASDSSSLDTMAMMMMQTEKFPEFCEPFCNTTLTTYQENEFSGRSSSYTTAVPIFNVAPPCLIDPPPSNVNFPSQQQQQQPPPMTTPLQQPNFVNPSGRFRNPNYSFLCAPSSSSEKRSSMAAMREMIFQIAVMQPIHIDPESVKPPKRRNVKISKDPQSVAARHRRERIGERIRILQRLVPGGTKMDTASMLDEAVHYVKFLKKQVQTLEQAGARRPLGGGDGGLFPGGMSGANVNDSALLMKGCQQPCHMVGYSSKQLLSQGVIN